MEGDRRASLCSELLASTDTTRARDLVQTLLRPARHGLGALPLENAACWLALPVHSWCCSKDGMVMLLAQAWYGCKRSGTWCRDALQPKWRPIIRPQTRTHHTFVLITPAVPATKKNEQGKTEAR